MNLYDISDLIVERAENGAFRLIFMERDAETGARCVMDIMEMSAKEAPYWSTAHGEIPADRIRARWPYDIGKATKTRSVVKKIVEQWSDPDRDTTESVTISDGSESENHSRSHGPSVPLTITVAPSLTPLAATSRLEEEGPFNLDGYEYEWDDDAKGPFARARIRFGTDSREEGIWHEFFTNGEPGDPIDESSFWVLV